MSQVPIALGQANRVKIATFNINNINKRLANLLKWLESERPEIVCLQELKTEQYSFPADALRSAGYDAAWVGERSWNGVAILAREQKPILTRSVLPGDDHDHQARYVEAAVRGVLICCIYLANGNPQPGPKFAYKLAWFERLIAHANDIPCKRPDRSWCADRSSGRLQCGANSAGYLPNSIVR